MANELEELQRWYEAHCDGDWEHQSGFEIGNIDNPGWRLEVDIADTELADQPFETIQENYEHPTDWLRCWVEDGKFEAAGGPLKLSRMLRIFLDWAAQHPPLPDSDT